MSDRMAILWAIVVVAFVAIGIVSCSATMDACKRAGGIPQYEYKNFPSCWTKDGRRLFPGVN